MKKFIGIGNWHDVDTSQYIYDILRAEKPDIIVAEYFFHKKFTTNSELCQMVVENTADYQLDQESKIISLCHLPIFPGTTGYPYESKAALVYAYDNEKPLFLIDRPFLSGLVSTNYFPKEVRDCGIIGFTFSKGAGSKINTAYQLILLDYQQPIVHHEGIRMRERNLFMRDAIKKIDGLYTPESIASVGGINHYIYEEEADWEDDYDDEDTLPNLVTAEEIRVYDAIQKKRIR